MTKRRARWVAWQRANGLARREPGTWLKFGRVARVSRSRWLGTVMLPSGRRTGSFRTGKKPV